MLRKSTQTIDPDLVQDCDVAVRRFLHHDRHHLTEELFVGLPDGVQVTAKVPRALDEDQEGGQRLEPVFAFVVDQPPVE